MILKVHFAHAKFFPTKSDLRRGVEWTCVAKSKPGDIALLYFHEPKKGIEIVGRIGELRGKWRGSRRWAKTSRLYNFAHITGLVPLERPLSLEAIREAFPMWGVWKNISGRNVVTVPPKMQTKLVALLVAENPSLKGFFNEVVVAPVDASDLDLFERSYEEGQTREYAIEQASRCRALVEDAKRVRGDICEVCGFNFGRRYGKYGAGFIEVHHLNPVSSYKGKKTVAVSLNDVRVVCANCHRMLHRGARCLDVKKLKNIVANAKE